MRQVRLLNAPHRIGTIDITRPPRERAGRRQVYIHFRDGGSSYHYEDEIEEVGNINPFIELGNGNLNNGQQLHHIIITSKLSGHLQSHIYSMEVSNTDFFAYQFKPLLRIFESPSKSILIADEVGLGKTIEAGLIWTELRARYNTSRMVILCPSILKHKWKLELKNKFNVDAEICDSREAIDVFKNKSHFVVIGSMEGWRGNEELSELLNNDDEAQIKIDYVVIDEAHKAKNRETKSFKLCQKLREKAEYFALLTATPIMLGDSDLFTLLQLIDPTTYFNPIAFNQLFEFNSRVIQLRDSILDLSRDMQLTNIRDSLNGFINNTGTHTVVRGEQQFAYAQHQMKDLVSFVEKRIEQPLTDSIRASIAEKLDYCSLFSMAINRTRRRDVTEEQRVRIPVDNFYSMTEEEEEIYDLISDTIYREYGTPGGLLGLIMAQRQLSSCLYAALARWLYRGETTSDDTYLAEVIRQDQDHENDMTREVQTEIHHARTRMQGVICDTISPIITHEKLDALRANDSKYNLLKRELLKHLRDVPTEKIILFSYFKGTLDYLQERFREDGINTIILHGGTGGPEDIIQKFRDDQSIRILLSSDRGSEGIDLQFSRIIINYDLLWNPMRLEQRIGRVDRIGQRSQQILIWNFVAENTIDEEIYTRIIKRLQIFKNGLGDIEEFIGSEINTMTKQLLVGSLTPEDKKRIVEQHALAIETRKRQEEDLEERAAHIISAGQSILQKINKIKELGRWISAEDILNFIQAFFHTHYPSSQCHIVQRCSSEEIKIRLKLDGPMYANFRTFLDESPVLRTRLRAFQDCDCTITHKLTMTNLGGRELVNQFHPLLTFAIQKIRRTPEPIIPVIGMRVSRASLADIAIIDGYYVFIIRQQTISENNTSVTLRHLCQHITSEQPLSLEDSERFINFIIGVSPEIIDTRTKQAIPFDHCQVLAYGLEEQLLDIEANAKEELYNKFRDRIEYQKHSREIKYSKAKSTLNDLIQRGDRMTPANRGRLRKLEESYKNDMDTIEHITQEFSSHEKIVAMGVIQVS